MALTAEQCRRFRICFNQHVREESSFLNPSGSCFLRGLPPGEGLPKVRTESAFDLVLFVHVGWTAKTDDNGTMHIFVVYLRSNSLSISFSLFGCQSKIINKIPPSTMTVLTLTRTRPFTSILNINACVGLDRSYISSMFATVLW